MLGFAGSDISTIFLSGSPGTGKSSVLLSLYSLDRLERRGALHSSLRLSGRGSLLGVLQTPCLNCSGFGVICRSLSLTCTFSNSALDELF